ncbi:hypothetical protein [Paenibacillus tianjinensis]|uniref:Uncharacterized protein n=1 Tax=Paenibacillus tianjinensis TaxID=2810347 RepID=A0ABX7LA98_9BACL|nr:hypothetical protein [Paenibacillus tianjinensis]QSF43360.1 hypothetical protein JRJ22_19025 [Paenibacillus tianjinensis]
MNERLLLSKIMRRDKMIGYLNGKSEQQIEAMLNDFERLNKYYLQEVTIVNEFAGHCFDIGQKVLLVDIIDSEIPLYKAVDLVHKQKCVIQEDEFEV